MALRRGTWIDRIAGFSIAGILVTPEILLALSVLIIAVRTGLLPVGGMYSAAGGDSTWQLGKDFLRHIIDQRSYWSWDSCNAHSSRQKRDVGRTGIAFATRSRSSRYRTVADSLPLCDSAFCQSADLAFGVSLATLLSSTLLVEVVMSWPGLGRFSLRRSLRAIFTALLGRYFSPLYFLFAAHSRPT